MTWEVSEMSVKYTLKTVLAIFFLFMVVVAPVSAMTLKEQDNVLRDAWKNENCRLTSSLMDEIQSSSQDLYLAYQGEALEYGYCVERDIDSAIEAYKKAHSISQKRVQFQIATLYLVEKNDPEKAQKWFRTLAMTYAPSPGSEDAKPENVANLKKSLKEIYVQHLRGRREFPEKEFNQALDWATELLGGAPGRTFEFALVFENGTNGYPINKNAVDRLLHEAVMQGYPPAAWRKAQQLLSEKRPLSHALSALKMAAHGGIVDAQVQVGRTYRDINKNKRYLERAYEWFVFARKNGANIENEIKTLESRIDPEKIIKIRKSIEVEGRVPK